MTARMNRTIQEQQMEHTANRIAMYAHGGSANHGCEAIIRTVTSSLAKALPGSRFTLVSVRKGEDERYLGTDSGMAVLDILQENDPLKDRLTHIIQYARRKLTGDPLVYPRYRFREITGENAPQLAISVGGDNYCYPSMVEELITANRMFREQGASTMLLGCSVEPDSLKDSPALREDMQGYALITPRETLTYEALLAAGVSREKMVLLPDPAFSLPRADEALPGWMQGERTVGLNVSPMLESYAGRRGISAEAYGQLVRHILDSSDMQVALIPHVVRGADSDLPVLERLAAAAGNSGRVHVIGDRNACALKTVIAGCSLFVGARTHSTIAAYSSMVPTLTVGYSVKSTGIAADLFGTADRYVLPVQQLEDPAQLVTAFEWLRENENGIREHLEQVIPEIVKKAGSVGKFAAALQERPEQA